MTPLSTHAISAVSFAYPLVDGPTRAELARRLVDPAPGSPVFVLSTCLRTEVVVPGGPRLLDDVLDELFGDAELAATGKRREGVDAVEHLYRIASGLESPILGEREVLTQFRQALAAAAENGNVDGIFGKLIETAVAVGRSSREVLPDSPHDSMAAVAAQVVGGCDRVAVLGSGLMATAVVKGLQGLPAPPDITVVARTPERVSDEAADIWGFDRAGEALADFPAVISATSASRRLVSDDEVAAIVGRRTHPLILVDMAMPPDFAVEPSPAVRYVDIDGLARMADRRARGVEADSLVREAAVEAHRAFVDHHEVGPVIGGIIEAADEIVDTAVARFAGRLSSGADSAVLRQAAHTVARTLVAGPIAYIKQPDRAPEAVDVVADAFGVDP